MAKTDSFKLLAELESLYEGYSGVLRAATQPYRLKKVLDENSNYSYRPDDPVIRESLLEHIGVLPMVATTFYPHINDPEVDLGDALIMLAIHDAGEIVTGDTMTFIKKAEGKLSEQEEARKLLHRSYHEIYNDMESQTSKTAKFAKAIDKIAADVLDYLAPVEITVRRFEHFAQIGPEQMVDVIIKHKRPYMLWNPFMTEFHIMLVEEFRKKLEAYLESRK